MAGTETTALALSTALFHMTKQPDLWLELDRQLRASLPEGSMDEYVDITALEKVPFLEAVAKESLRVSCPISGRLPRNVPDGGWKFRGEIIPAGVRQTKSHFLLSSTNPTTSQSEPPSTSLNMFNVLKKLTPKLRRPLSTAHRHSTVVIRACFRIQRNST